MAVKIIGADEVARRFKELQTGGPNLQQMFLDEISRSSIELLKANTPKDTGNLANSWHESGRTNNSVTISLKDFGGPAVGFSRTTNNDKLRFIIFGTRPHEIRARNFKTLKFEYPKGSGIFVYPQSVQHPGNPTPNNFVLPILQVIKSNIDSVMRRLMKQSHRYYSNIGAGTAPSWIVGGSTKTPSIIGGLTVLTSKQKGARKSVGSGKIENRNAIRGRGRYRPHRVKGF